MAQHDYVIANASGATVRADINNMALAISSNNSGSSAPGTTYAYLWWLDTSANVLKLRNSANNAWITMPFSIGANNTVDINGGAIDGTAIGASAASTGAFTSLTASLASTITTADNTDTLSLISTDADANVAPNLRMYRNSGSPTDSDQLGKISLVGRNDNSQDVIYAQIGSQIKDASDGTEDGRIFINSIVAGTTVSRIDMTEGETVFNNDTVDLDFRVESDGNANMLFVDGGNDRVGLGTASPSSSLHVFGNSSSRNTIVSNVTLDGGTGAANPYEGFGFGIDFIGRDYGNAVRNYAGIYSLMETKSSSSGGGDAGFASGLSFYTNTGGASGTNPSEKVRIDKDGSVGIATTSPAGKFHVAGHTGSVASIFEANANGDTVPVQLKVKANNGTTSTQGLYGNAGSASTDNTITLGTSGTSGLTVTNGGSVGIGTTSPAAKLSVHGSVQFRTTNTDGNEERINWNVGGASDAPSQTMYGADGATAKVLLHAGGASYFTGGNLGVGDDSPAYRLELPNTASAAGQVRANAYQTYSDSRIKTNIQTLSYGLDIVKQLKPSQYKHHNSIKEDGQFVKQDEGANDIGFIAQEVLPLIPEVVSVPVDTDKDLYSISYPKLTAVLTKAIQEQQEQIEQLKTEIQTLKGE